MNQNANFSSKWPQPNYEISRENAQKSNKIGQIQNRFENEWNPILSEKRAKTATKHTQFWQSTIHGQFWKMPKLKNEKSESLVLFLGVLGGPKTTEAKYQNSKNQIWEKFQISNLRKIQISNFKSLFPKCLKIKKIKEFCSGTFEKSKTRKIEIYCPNS